MNMEILTSKNRTIIKPFEEQNLKIYAYTLPEIPNHNGCIKVGETTRTVEDRINEQTRTAGLTPNILFKRKAKKKNGEWFHDKDLHRYFILNDIERKDFGTGADEWFYFNGTPEKCEFLTDKFIADDYTAVEISEGKFDYILRDEQAEAVEKTLNYYKNHSSGKEFLWNAKPRFGKTLTTYDLIRKMKAKNVLIVTNRPAIANSWWDDFNKFIAWQEPDLKFISDSDSLNEKVMTREEYVSYIASKDEDESANLGCIAFVSLQDLKGARVFGGNYDKLEWIAQLDWDMLVIDEAHEGVDTFKTDRAFRNIKREFTLHLSGTPFKAIANNKFTEDQIYNWSYVDEQKAKLNWDNEKDTNPYAALPTLSLFTYQMSKMIQDKISEGAEISEENNVDYAFDLNEFFRTKENGSFVYEDSVLKFLDNLTEKKFPFAETEYRHMLNHTFWLLPGVAPCKAMEKLLKKHHYFKDYKTVLAAGDGQSLSDEQIDENIETMSDDIKANEKSYDKVKKAIAENEKTITLSCGQLTTGVTIPEWTAVFMLSNIKSPSLYFQAAFRSQNPYEFTDKKSGELFRKENSYIFDFAPERTLNLFDDFANNLSIAGAKGTSEIRQENIRELLNFFPVIAEDETGTMHEIDAGEVLTIPNKIKSREVVKQGFMSNLLFANIGAIFKAPAAIKEILDKIKPEKNKRLTEPKEINVTDPMIDDEGEVNVPEEIVINKAKDIFGEKIFKKDVSYIDMDEKTLEKNNSKDNEKDASEISKLIVKEFSSEFNDFKKEFDIKKTELEKVKEKVQEELKKKITFTLDENTFEIQRATEKYNNEISRADTEEEKKKKTEEFEKVKRYIEDKINNEINRVTQETVSKAVETEIVKKEETKKKETEDEVRDHLRGFARTIPAFLMAYGDRNTKLSNFDKKIDEDTFLDLTSITLDEFRILRDGMIVKDEETGIEREVPGLFDEIVFDASIQEFLDIKEKLADYFDENNKEDIFDYIPDQKTNQVFTPRNVVKMMLDSLEESVLDIFKDKNRKFIDLYIKSGLFLTEIAKKLYEGLKDQIPDKEERIKWIFENQLYGAAPSNIIYNIAKNFIFGKFDYNIKNNIIECDMLPVVEKGKLKDKIKEIWGENMKFDVVVGNPPYQENISENSSNSALSKQLFPFFVTETIKLKTEYVSLIIPARWFSGNAQDKSFLKLREFIKNNNHISKLFYYEDANDIFPGVEIKGGVCYFLYDIKHLGKMKFYNCNKNVKIMTERNLFVEDYDIIFTENFYPVLLSKIVTNEFIPLTFITKGRNAFGIIGKQSVVDKISKEEYFENSCELRCKDNEIRYTDPSNVTKNKDLCINKYKVFISKSAGAPHKDKKVIGMPYIGKKNSACTDSLIPIGEFSTEEEAENLKKYLETKFLRILVQVSKSSQNVTQIVYRFVPMQDFTSNSDIDWTKSIEEIDEQLFDKYNLSEEERNHIKSSIKYME